MDTSEKGSGVKMWWWSGVDNFGDWIGPWLVEKKTGRRVFGPTHSAIYSAGSIVGQVKAGGIVWGSGIINSGCMPSGQASQIDVRAVRGPLTRRRLNELNFSCPEIFGDPALLLPRFYPRPAISENKEQNRRYKLGIIPHYVDYETCKGLPIAQNPNVLLIDLKTRNVEKVIDQILQCEATISSSLHGIIVSVAYGISTRWVMFGNQIYGNHIKYFDFWLSLTTSPELVKAMTLEADCALKYFRDHQSWPLSNKEFREIAHFLPLDFRGNSLDLFPIEPDEIVTQTFLYTIPPLLLDRLIEACPF